MKKLFLFLTLLPLFARDMEKEKITSSGTKRKSEAITPRLVAFKHPKIQSTDTRKKRIDLIEKTLETLAPSNINQDIFDEILKAPEFKNIIIENNNNNNYVSEIVKEFNQHFISIIKEYNSPKTITPSFINSKLLRAQSTDTRKNELI